MAYNGKTLTMLKEKKMKFIFLVAALLAANVALADNYVNGYTKSNGTYVQPHMRSEPNQYKSDNYSSQGNSNPYTNQAGSKPNEYSNPPSYNKSYGKTPCYDNCKDD